MVLFIKILINPDMLIKESKLRTRFERTMRFCPECDNFLYSRKVKGEKMLVCESCGHEEPFDEQDKEVYTVKQKLDHKKDQTIVLTNSGKTVAVTEDDRDAHEDFFQASE